MHEESFYSFERFRESEWWDADSNNIPVQLTLFTKDGSAQAPFCHPRRGTCSQLTIESMDGLDFSDLREWYTKQIPLVADINEIDF